MLRNRRSNQNSHYGYLGQMGYYGPMDQKWNQAQNLRQQHPYQPMQQNVQWNPYQQQGPAFLQQPYGHFEPMNISYQNQPYQQQKDSQFLFSNPLQPQEKHMTKPYVPMNGMAMMNPYPKNNMMLKQPGGMNSFLNSFKSQDGSVDFNKMMNTAGQMMNAVSQVSALVKGFGGILNLKK